MPAVLAFGAGHRQFRPWRRSPLSGRSRCCCSSTSPARCGTGCRPTSPWPPSAWSSSASVPWPRPGLAGCGRDGRGGLRVLFGGVVSSVLAGRPPVAAASHPARDAAGDALGVPARLAGWALARSVGRPWGCSGRRRPRSAAWMRRAACRGLAARLRADWPSCPGAEHRARRTAGGGRRSDEACAALRRDFLATPCRPTGLSTPARTLVRLVDELSWLTSGPVQASAAGSARPTGPPSE